MTEARYKKVPHHNKGKKGEFSPQYGIRGTEVYIYDHSTLELVKQFPSINSASQFCQIG